MFMKRSLLLFVALSIMTVGYGYAKAKDTAIRGVWVPAPKFTDVLHTYQNIQKFVALLDELNFNAVYLVSYAESKTIYSSEVIKKYAQLQDVAQTNLLTPYLKNYHQPVKSPTGDPIQDLIRLAHKRKIKVFFWYEYGFMGDVKPLTSENPLFANNPDWLGLGNDGKPTNYHQKDFYYNAYSPKVQKYLLELIEEGIKLYPGIDGIQGDDRMPAMPKNSGYDEVTVSRYKASHDGQSPPHDFNDKDWVQWRIDLLNDFAKQLYNSVKAIDKKIMVSFAPNPYPWSKENLMQDWPQWIRNGVCDLLAVQCYRYTAEAYKGTVTEVLNHVRQNNPKQLIATGIILMESGNVKMSRQLLKEQIAINRSLGVKNEIYFYNEALKDEGMQTTFRELYPRSVAFPKVR